LTRNRLSTLTDVLHSIIWQRILRGDRRVEKGHRCLAG
jgi:hypothetical protein